MLRHLTAACLLVAAITTTAAAQQQMRPILEEGGTWHGVGVQTGDLHWPMEVELSATAPKLSVIATTLAARMDSSLCVMLITPLG